MKYHIIVVQDVHFWYKNLTNRVDYVGECMKVYESIKRLLKKTREENRNDKIYLVFLGDIFHKGFGVDTLSFNLWIQLITVLRALCNGIYATMGNHEWSFREGNPFWSLINRIESPALERRGAKCYGNLPIIQLKDHLELGDFRLHFCHHNTEIYNIKEDGNNILFAHEYWMTKPMFNSLESAEGGTVQKKYLKYREINNDSVIKNFRLAFFGHMHRLIGSSKIEWEDNKNKDTYLYHLGSLVLTNKDEVLNTGNKRLIPEIIIEDSHLDVIEHIIEISNGPKILKYETVKKNEKKYKELKEKKEIKLYESLYGKDPIKKIEEDLTTNGKLERLDIFRNLEVEGGMPTWLQNII